MSCVSPYGLVFNLESQKLLGLNPICLSIWQADIQYILNQKRSLEDLLPQPIKHSSAVWRTLNIVLVCCYVHYSKHHNEVTKWGGVQKERNGSFSCCHNWQGKKKKEKKIDFFCWSEFEGNSHCVRFSDQFSSSNIDKTHQPGTGEISVPKTLADLHVDPASWGGISLGLQRLAAATQKPSSKINPFLITRAIRINFCLIGDNSFMCLLFVFLTPALVGKLTRN